MRIGQTVIHIADQQTDAILDFIPEDGYWADLRTQSLENQLDTLDFTTFTGEAYAQHLVKRNRVIIMNPDGKLSEYIIEENEQNDDRIKEVYCSASYIELSKTRWISPTTTGALTAEQHVTSALQGTEWEAPDVPFNGVRDFTFDQYTDALTYLRRVALEFELELYFRVEHNGTRVTKRYVEFVERIGKWGGYEATFGNNITSLVRTEKTTDVVTKLIAIGPDRQEGQGPLVVEVADDEALARWGRNGLHLVDVYRPETADQDMTESRLRTLAKAELNKRLNAQISYSVSIIDLSDIIGIEEQQLRLGDSVRVKDEGFSPALYVDARVHTIKGSIKSDAVATIELGDFIEYTKDEIFAFFQSLQAELAKKISQAELADYVTEFGGDTIVRSDTAPTDTTVYWLDTSVVPNVLKSWDGYEWVKATPTNAEEVGAETPQGALTTAIVQALKVELQNVEQTRNDIEYRYEEIVGLSYLIPPAVMTELNVRYTAFLNANTALNNAITSAIADDNVIAAEASQIATARGSHNTALTNFFVHLSSLSAQVMAGVKTENQTFVQEYANRKIHQGTTAPSSPQSGDLWIDVSSTPYVWKRYDGANWVNAVATSISDLNGELDGARVAVGSLATTKFADGAITAEKIATNAVVAGKIAAGAVTAEKIAANSITSNMIATVGLDAGVIKAGTISSSVLFAGQLYGATGTFSGSLSAASGTFQGSIVGGLITGSTFTSTAYDSSWGTNRTMILNDGQLKIDMASGVGGVVVNPSLITIKGSSASTYASMAPTQLVVANSSGSISLSQGMIQTFGNTTFNVASGTLSFSGSVSFASASVTGLSISYTQVSGLSNASVNYASSAGNANQLGGVNPSGYSLSGHEHSEYDYVKSYTGQALRLWRSGSTVRVYQGSSYTQLTGTTG